MSVLRSRDSIQFSSYGGDILGSLSRAETDVGSDFILPLSPLSSSHRPPLLSFSLGAAALTSINQTEALLSSSIPKRILFIKFILSRRSVCWSILLIAHTSLLNILTPTFSDLPAIAPLKQQLRTSNLAHVLFPIHPSSTIQFVMGLPIMKLHVASMAGLL